MITLKEFIKQTLSEITGATAEFNAEHASGASANPQIHEGQIAGVVRTMDGGSVVGISFDVAVTSEDASQASGKGGIKVLPVFDVTGGIEKIAKTTTASRVQFTIPLGLPETEEVSYHRQRRERRRHEAESEAPDEGFGF